MQSLSGHINLEADIIYKKPAHFVQIPYDGLFRLYDITSETWYSKKYTKSESSKTSEFQRYRKFLIFLKNRQLLFYGKNDVTMT